MYIINTSFMVEQKVHDQWYTMLTNKFMPLLRTEGFAELTLTRVLTNGNDGHHTYSLQVNVPDIPTYQRFMEQMIGQYTDIAMPAFGERALHFSTLLKRIEL